MTHRPEHLSAMLDGELSEAEVSWVAGHLEGCGECRAELEDLASARAAVRSLPVLDLPDDIVPASPNVVRLWPHRAAVAVISVAAAAAVAVGALGMIGMTADATTNLDVGEAGAILAATSSLGVTTDGSVAGEYLTSGSGAHFNARQTMACWNDENRVDTTFDITKMGSVTVMSDPLAQLTVLANGTVATGPVDGPIDSVTVTGPAPDLGDYAVTDVVTDEHRDRITRIVTLARDGTNRVRVWIDIDTGVIVYRELLASDGSVACVSELVEFEPSDVPIRASIPFDITAETAEELYEPTSAEFPEALAGLALVATYAVDDGEVAVYADGVFSFAVMRVDGGHPDAEASEMSPASVWESDGTSWAIVGSMPADMMQAARDALPTPDDPNPFTDGWRILFG